VLKNVPTTFVHLELNRSGSIDFGTSDASRMRSSPDHVCILLDDKLSNR
jgi:hypothetical protein